MIIKTLKWPVPLNGGPTNAGNRGSTHLHRTTAELVPHSPLVGLHLNRGFLPSRATQAVVQ